MNQQLENKFKSIIPQNLTIRQFGEIYGPKPTKTYALLKSGEIRGVKIGRNTYIPCAEAERWSQELPAYKPENVTAIQNAYDRTPRVK